ncbi:hypothetical protein C5Z26_03125 [Lactobacillus sp. CBA3606]|nr:hypothetical protein C5Z26_03125 [Lactobacillus sp. CBA3606]
MKTFSLDVRGANMNRKILVAILSILLILYGFIGLTQSQSKTDIRQAQRATRVSSQRYQLFTVPKVPTSQKNYGQLIAALNHAAKKTHTNYFKRQIKYGWAIKNQQVNYSQSLTRVTFQIAGVKPTTILSNGNQPHARVTSRRYLLKKPRLGFKLTMEPIEQSVRQDQREGDYYLESSDSKTYHRFLKLSAYYLNQETHEQTTSKEFRPSKQDKAVLLVLEATDLAGYQVTILCFLGIFIVILLLDSSQIIAAYRLNGFTVFKIFTSFFSKIIMVTIAILGVEFVITMLIGWKISIIEMGTLLLGLVPILIISWLTIWGMTSLSLTNQVRRRNYNRWTFLGLYVVKAFFIVYMFLGLIPLLQVATGSYNVLKGHTEASIVGNQYAVFYPHVTGNDFVAGNITWAELNQLDTTMYTAINKRGGLFFNDDSIYQAILKRYQYLSVNPNYLRQYPLYDTSGQRITIAENTSSIWMLMPTTAKPLTTKMVASIKTNFVYDFGYRPVVKVVYYPANQALVDLTNGKTIKAWPMLISTQNNTGSAYRSVMNGQGARDGLKVPVKGNVRKTYMSLRPILVKNNYLDNYPQLVKLNDLPMEDLKMAVGNLLHNSVAVTISAIVTFFLTGYITLLYFKVNKNSLTIKRVNGYSLFKTYHPLMVMLMTQAGVMSYLTVSQHQNNFYYWALTGLITIIEFGIVCLTVKRLERQNMKELLNDK